MPSRNVIKQDVHDSYYHVYFRGGNRSKIFRDAADFEKMLHLFARYLSREEIKNSAGISFPNYYNKLEIVAFCLMPNHVHLLIYQHQQGAMADFMRSLLTSFSMYFNKTHKRSGPLFESRYKASLITDLAYLEHITRYIHLNPKQWREYEYSSLPYYLHQVTDEWIKPQRIIHTFSRPNDYIHFMEDYEQNKELIDILRHELANGNEI